MQDDNMNPATPAGGDDAAMPAAPAPAPAGGDDAAMPAAPAPDGDDAAMPKPADDQAAM